MHHQEVAAADVSDAVKATETIPCVAVHGVFREPARVREDRSFPSLVDLPDVVPRGVRDVSVALEVHSDVVGGGFVGVSFAVGGGGEEGEEEAVAGAEVVGGECVEGREGFEGVESGEDAVVAGIDGDAQNGDVFGQGGIGD